MRTVEMLRDTRPMYHLVLLVYLCAGYVQPLPLQVLPSIPGYIPVFIRYGDQPLEEINPALAEAFSERSSLSKNINLDNVPVPADLNIEEGEENKYKVEVVHVREVDNFSEKDEDSNKPPLKIAKAETEKPTADSSNKGNHHEKSRRKVVPKPVVKVLPLTEEEKKTLEMLQIEVREAEKSERNMKKEAKDSGSAHDSKQYLLKLSKDETHDKDSNGSSESIIKVDSIIVDEPSQLNLHLTKNDDASASPLTNNESPVKEERFPNVLSNVHKLLPSPEVLVQLEKERAENQSLEDKSN